MKYMLFDYVFEFKDFIEVYAQPFKEFPEHFQDLIGGITGQETVILDPKRNIGFYFVYYRIGRTTLAELTEEVRKEQKIDRDAFILMLKQLAFDLFEYHTHGTVLMKLAPRTIAQDFSGKYFIIPTTDWIELKAGQNLARLTSKIRSPYSIPAMNIGEESQLVMHNPLKSDVYSLGKILQQVFESSGLPENKTLYIRESAIIQKHLSAGKGESPIKIQWIPDLFSVMTNPQEQERFGTLQLILYIGDNTWIRDLIDIKYETYFPKSIQKISPTANFVRIKYHHLPIEVEGETQEQIFDKNDPIGKQLTGYIKCSLKRAVLYNNGNKILEGEFLNNRPHGKCKINIKGTWHYEGQIKDFRFNGPATLVWGNNTASQGVYKSEFMDDVLISCYRNQPHLKNSTLHSVQASQKINTFRMTSCPTDRGLIQINLVALQNEQFMVLGILKYINLRQNIQSIKLSQNTFNNIFSRGLIDIVQLVLQTKQIIVIACKVGFGRQIFSYYCASAETIQILDLSESSRTNDQDLKLFTSCKLPNLKQINIANSSVSDFGLISFLDQRTNIQRFDISNTKITQHGLTFLIHSKTLKLTSLKFNNLVIKHSLIFDRLFSCDKVKNTLQALQLEGVRLQNSNILKLIAKPQFMPLISLNLSKCVSLTDKVLQDLFTNCDFRYLQQLSLSHLNIQNKVIEAFCQNRQPIRLTKLDISGCLSIKATCLKTLLKSDKLMSIVSLNLSSTQLTDDNLNEFCDQLLFKELNSLNISCCPNITEAGLNSFFINGELTKLRSLNLTRLKVKQPRLLYLFHDTSSFRVNQLYMFSLKPQHYELISNLKQVEYLHLVSAQITNIEHLSWIPKLTSLRKLDVWVDKIIGVQLLKFCPSVLQLIFKGGDMVFENQDTSQTSVVLSRETQQLISLSQSRLFQRITSLDLSNNYMIEDLKTLKLFESPLCRNISQINISNSSLGPNFLQALYNHTLTVSEDNKIKLRKLSVSGVKQPISDILAKLFKTSFLRDMEVLDLSWSDINNSPLNSIPSSLCTELLQLSLNNMPYITDQGIQSLFSNSSNTPQSKSIGCPAQQLCHSLSKLQHLDLRYTNITNRSIEALVGYNTLSQLTNLYLAGCQYVNMASLRKFLQSQNAKSLATLDLGWMKLDNSLFEVLARGKTSKLRKLILTGLKECWQHFEEYVDSQHFQHIQQLDLSYSTIKDKHINKIVGSKTRLSAVNTTNCLVTQQSVFVLNQYLTSRLAKKKQQQRTSQFVV